MIRRVQLADLDDVMMIERTSFPVAWEYTIFFNICIQEGEVVSGSETLFMDVLEKSNSVVGYAVWEINNKTSVGHILNLAIHVDERRKGNGKKLLSHMLNQFRINNMRSCHLEVRESNTSARKLYESYGFTATSKISRYYFDEDAIVYTLNLT